MKAFGRQLYSAFLPRVDKTGEVGRPMEGRNELRQRDLKRRIERHVYDVDAREVAAAVIVKLALCEGSRPGPRARSGPIRKARPLRRERRAA
jgi:hypothetical protein